MTKRFLNLYTKPSSALISMNRFLSSLLLILSIHGCAPTKNTTSLKNLEAQKIWDLVNVKGGFEAINVNYKSESMTWSFNEENQTLTVTNNLASNELYGVPSGTYEYNIQQNKGNTYLVIEKSHLRLAAIENNQLTVVQTIIIHGVGVSEYTLYFEKG